MTELKTLKDLINDGKIDGGSEDNLKEEAIKWVKELENQQNPVPFTAPMPAPNYEPVINFIKHFFNITEEDLK